MTIQVVFKFICETTKSWKDISLWVKTWHLQQKCQPTYSRKLHYWKNHFHQQSNSWSLVSCGCLPKADHGFIIDSTNKIILNISLPHGFSNVQKHIHYIVHTKSNILSLSDYLQWQLHIPDMGWRFSQRTNRSIKTQMWQAGTHR